MKELLCDSKYCTILQKQLDQNILFGIGNPKMKRMFCVKPLNDS